MSVVQYSRGAGGCVYVCSSIGIHRIYHLNAVYIGTRPFVLRDASDPTQNLQIADSAEILEAVELRLKDDILREAAKSVPIDSLYEKVRT